MAVQPKQPVVRPPKTCLPRQFSKCAYTQNVRQKHDLQHARSTWSKDLGSSAMEWVRSRAEQTAGKRAVYIRNKY
eukprot:747591-Hanusia_phi.AAC.10